MKNEDQDYCALANLRLIAQAAEYHNSTKRDLETYQDMNLSESEVLAAKHLAHWKRELHELIFNGLNCHERLA